MVYPEVIHGKFVDLRSITLDDAEFSYNIRADERNRDTVGQLAASVDAQRKFIEWQMNESNDYYFVVLNKKGERIGLYGVYGIHNGMAEIGREVNVGEPAERMEVSLLVSDFCRSVLKLKKVSFVIYANNIHRINEAKKMAHFIRFVKRGNFSALYFESDLYEKNLTAEKTRRLINQLFAKQGD